jgi:hypothetical protein
MAVYKVSYVIRNSNHPGGIINLEEQPKIGENIHLGDLELQIVELHELMPPRGAFNYLHVTCKLVEKEDE